MDIHTWGFDISLEFTNTDKACKCFCSLGESATRCLDPLCRSGRSTDGSPDIQSSIPNEKQANRGLVKSVPGGGVSYKWNKRHHITFLNSEKENKLLKFKFHI